MQSDTKATSEFFNYIGLILDCKYRKVVVVCCIPVLVVCGRCGRGSERRLCRGSWQSCCSDTAQWTPLYYELALTAATKCQCGVN